MRKITLIAFLSLAFIAFLTSCSNSGNKKVAEYRPEIPQLYYAGYDTSATEVHNIFEEKNYTKTVCATGEKVKGKYWKLVGKDTVYFSTTKQGPEVPRDSIELWFRGTTKVVTEKSSTNTDSNIGGTGTSNGHGFWWFLLNWILPILLAIIGLILLIRWLSSLNWPEKNSSPKKGNNMNNSAANPERIAALNAMLLNLKGADGNGKGSVKDNHPIEGFEVTAGKGKTMPNVTILNTGNGTVNMGDVFNFDSNNNCHNTGIPRTAVLVVGPKKDEPKKEEPAAPAATSPS